MLAKRRDLIKLAVQSDRRMANALSSQHLCRIGNLAAMFV
jgi:hypothetical protein